MSQSKQFDPHAYWEDRLRRYFSLRGTGSWSFSDEYNRMMYDLKVRALDDVLARVAIERKPIHVLNLGCGTGFFDDYFERRFQAEITGIDISDYAISRLREKHPSRVYWCGELPRLVEEGKVASGDYDIVTAIDVLYHIVDPERFHDTFAQLCRSVRDGGVLIFTDRLYSRGLQPAPHVTWHSLNQYTAMLNERGFGLQAVRPMYWHFDNERDLLYRFGKRMLNLMFLTDWYFARLRRFKDSMTMCCAQRIKAA